MKIQFMIPILVGILILGTLSFENKVYAPSEELFGAYHLASKGPVTCTTFEDESCGDGKSKSKFRMLVQNVDKDTISGIAKGKIEVKFAGDDAPRAVFQSKNLKFEITALDGIPNQMSLTGNVKDQNGNTWNLDLVGDNIMQQNAKAQRDLNSFQIDLNMNLLGGQEGEDIISGTSTGLVINLSLGWEP